VANNFEPVVTQNNIVKIAKKPIKKAYTLLALNPIAVLD
jgi:hypothetical protein